MGDRCRERPRAFAWHRIIGKTKMTISARKFPKIIDLETSNKILEIRVIDGII